MSLVSQADRRRLEDPEHAEAIDDMVELLWRQSTKYVDSLYDAVKERSLSPKDVSLRGYVRQQLIDKIKNRLRSVSMEHLEEVRRYVESLPDEEPEDEDEPQPDLRLTE
jgi:hypothetical protein